MKYICQTWEERYDGILFFIQRLQEMLFHYADDVVKAPIHNTSSLIKEYKKTRDDLTIKQYHLDIIKTELISSLKDDMVAQKVLGEVCFRQMLKSLNSTPNETIDYLSRLIDERIYYNETTNMLLKALLDNDDKDKISSLLRKWISSTVFFGYDPEYVYHYLHELFDCPVDDPKNTIIEFFDNFNLTLRQYRVYFKFHGSMDKYKTLLSERLNISFSDDGYFDNLKMKRNDFAGYMDIEATNPSSAKNIEFRNLGIFTSFYIALTNETGKLVKNNCMVRDLLSNKLTFHTLKENGFKSIKSSSNSIDQVIDTIVLSIQNKEGSYEIINKIVRLHNNGIIQNDLDDGFVNLWSVLEVACVNKKDKSKINAVTKKVVPILQNDFFDVYFEVICNELHTILGLDSYQDLLESIDIDNEKPACKIAALCLIEKYNDVYDDLMKQLGQYPNVRYKLEKINKLKSSRKKLIALSNSYAERVRWHLYRLYRVRNLIVHDGETNRNIHILGQHLHIYCDRVLIELLTKLSTHKYLQTIDDVFFETNSIVNYKLEHFNSKEAVSIEDIYVLFSDEFE